MDSSNRQSEILEKLARIREELARKERKLQKLKRLSALKKGQDSLQNESIGSDETRLSTSADVCSPLRVPLETTLPESEVCHSKLQRTKTPEEKSFSREEAKSTLQAETSDSHERRLQANRSSSSVCTPLAITARDTAPADGPSRLTVTIASPRRKSSRLEALSGRTRSQRELFTNNVAHSSIKNGDTASFSHALEVNSHLSVPKKSYADAPQDANGNKVAECNFNPKANACEVLMPTNASLSMSRLNNASFLDMLLQDSQPEVKDSDSTAAGRLSQQDKVTLSAETSCGAVKPRFSQEEKVRRSVTSNTTPHQNGNKQKRSTGLSLVRWTKEDTWKQSSGKSTDDAEKCEVNIVAEDELHFEVFNPCDDDSRDSQQELFVHEDEPDVIVEDAPLKVMAEDKGGINEQPVKEGTKMTEKQCNTDKAPDPSESHSPMRKRRRTRSYEPTTITADTKDANYNFRKRKLSYSPFWKKRMSRESKTIASAFSKLIQGALKTPISMFELNFEQFGLAECAEAKGLSTDPDSASQLEKSRLTVDDNTSSERSSPGRSEACLQIEPDKRASTVSKGESRTLDDSDSCVLARQTEVFPAENVPWRERKLGRRSSRRQRKSSTVAEGTASESPTNDATSVPDKHYAARAKISSPLAAWETVGNAAPASNGNSDSMNTSLPSQLSGDYTAPASQRGETPRNTSRSQIGTSCVPLHVARNNREVPTHVLSSSACSDGGSCRQESSKSQHPSLSSPSITRCGKMEGSGKPEHVSRDKSSEDAADSCDHAIPVLPKSEHSSCLDLQGSSELAEGMPPLSSSDLACKGEEESSQEAEDTGADRSTALRGEVVEYFSQDDCNVQGGGQASELGGVTTVVGSAHSTLFSQSEESESAEDIKDFVSGIVERLGVADGKCPGFPSGATKNRLEDSETPDELNLPEVVIGGSRASSGDLLISSCRTDHRTAHRRPKDDFPESRRDTGSTEESTTLLSSLQACSGVSSAKEQSSGSPIAAPGLPPCVLAEERRSESEEKDIDSICPPPAKIDPVGESELQCTVSKRPVAKRLFADPTTSSRLASVVDSEPQELMDPCELEGMFDEWSEECNLNTAYLSGVKKDPKNVTQGLRDSHRGDKSSTSGCGDSESRSSERVDGSQIKAVKEGRSDGSEKDKSTEHDSESCNQGSQNESLAGTDLPAEAVAESAEEVTAAEGDQCSESLSSSLQPLSDLSNFMEEDVGDGELAELSELERNNEPQEIGSLEHRMSEPDDCWGDEDGGRPDQDCMDAKDEGGDCKTLSDSSLVLGTKRPLLFFCELKCATKQPVSRVFVVRATPRPFLVSVQAGAVNVWHLEKTWRHTLVAGNIKFPVEEGEGPQSVLLLRCGQWSVLVYLSPRQAPLQLPCVLWDARDGRHCCQLLLTLGEKGSATAGEEDSPTTTTKGGLCIYRLARLTGCEGRFASALKTASGATLLRVHQVRCFRGEFGDETEFLGRTSNLLDSLVPVEGLPSALLGNHANIFYVWDCENRVLVKKMVLEPDLFADMRHISWCCSEKGLLFALMRSLDDVTSTLVAMNPFSCKAEPVCSASWKPTARARVDDSRPCGVQVEGRYVACIGPGYGVRIWNLFTGNPVADMRYQSSTSCAVAEFADSAAVAVGSDDGRVLVFTC
ncbi:uncharacterized protein LOC144138665 [Haemaphysalis longicornis]